MKMQVFSRFSSVIVVLLLLLGGCSSHQQFRKPTADQRDSYDRVLALSVLSLRQETTEGHAQAKAGFELLIELIPNDPRAWDGLASIAIRYGWFSKAKEYLHYAIKCDSRYVAAYEHLGFVSELERDREMAQHYYNTSLKLDPLNVGARLGIARLSDDRVAIAELRKLSFIYPKSHKNPQ